MGGESPVVELYDSNGNPLSVQDGVAIPASTPGLLFMGSDGTNSRYILVDGSSRQIVVGAGTAGTPTGGVITVQGDPSGTPIPISGNITASNASVGTNDSSIPGFSTLIGGSDGTNLRSLRVFDLDSGGGQQWILGVGLRKSAGGGSVELGTSSDPIRIDPTGTTTQPVSGTVTANQGGTWTVQPGNTANTTPWLTTINQGGNSATVTGSNALKVDGSAVTQPVSGTVTVTQATASNLRAQLASESSTGSAIPSTAVMVGGSDGSLLRSLFLDSSGRQIIVGAVANGAAVAGNPVLVGGSDGTNARSIRTATDGTVRIDPTGTTTQPVSGTVAATQSGTWTVQPGNTANTTPWLTTISQGGNSATVTGSNALKVDGSAVTQPVSDAGGSLTVDQATAANLNAQVVGNVADGAAVSGNPVRIGGSDGTNVQNIITDTTGRLKIVGAAADGTAVTGDPVLVAGQDGTNAQTLLTDTSGKLQVVVNTTSSGSITGLVFGQANTGGAANVLVALRATTYTEQSANAQRSLNSTSILDTSAGTGARQVKITYFDSTLSGPFTETVTLNGLTTVTTTNTNICFVEKMEVVSVGTLSSNQGTISLFVNTLGNGVIIGSIGVGNVVSAGTVGDNQTLWAHHYVATGKTAQLGTIVSGTTGNQTGRVFIKYANPLVSTNVNTQLTEPVVVTSNSSSTVRSSGFPIQVSGPARITQYVVSNGSNTTFFGGFEYSES